MRIINCIEDPVVIQTILDQLKKKHDTYELFPLPESRAPPGAGNEAAGGDFPGYRHESSLTSGGPRPGAMGGG